MRRRTVLLGLGLVVGVMGLCAGMWLTTPRPQINDASYQRIKEGMNQQEVEQILGGPPGNYGSLDEHEYVSLGKGVLALRLRDCRRADTWASHRCVITVCYDD